MNVSEISSVVVTQHRLVRDLEEMTGYAWYTKMPETKIVKFLKQFPWVRRLINPDDISRVYVSGIDPVMITRIIRFDGFTDSREFAFLVDENGELVSRVAEWTVSRKKFIFFGPVTPTKKTWQISGSVEPCSTIQCKLEQLGDEAEKIQFLLSFHSWTKVAIVYKRPKGVSLKKWLSDED